MRCFVADHAKRAARCFQNQRGSWRHTCTDGRLFMYAERACYVASAQERGSMADFLAVDRAATAKQGVFNSFSGAVVYQWPTFHVRGMRVLRGICAGVRPDGRLFPGAENARVPAPVVFRHHWWQKAPTSAVIPPPERMACRIRVGTEDVCLQIPHNWHRPIPVRTRWIAIECLAHFGHAAGWLPCPHEPTGSSMFGAQPWIAGNRINGAHRSPGFSCRRGSEGLGPRGFRAGTASFVRPPGRTWGRRR